MHINSNPRIVEVKGHPFFKETMYCFCSINTFDKEVYDIEHKLNVDKDRISVYWTQEQIKQFRPSDNTHEYLKTLDKEVIQCEIKTMRRIKRSPHYTDHSKKEAQHRIERLGSQIIIFVKINLVN
jgi:hypothetical protein